MGELAPFVETWETLLNHFCSRDDLRPGMSSPNLIGDYIYATDTHSWIKIPFRPSFRNYKKHDKAPNFESVEKAFVIIEPIIIRKNAIEKALSKFHKKPDWKVCKECRGNGVIECDCCGHQNECENCDGTGAIDDYIVPEVYDSGAESDMGIRIGENIVAPFQLGRLLRVINFLNLPSISLFTNVLHKALVFRASNVEIVIMGLFREDKEMSKLSVLEL